jgi:hypothetical protein
MARARKRQINVGLDDATRLRLEESASKSGRSIADEIRSRIWETFGYDEYDAPTRALARDVADLATKVQTASGVSWAHPAARVALVVAVQEWLAKINPPELADVPKPRELSDPSVVGRAVARLHRHAMEEDKEIVRRTGQFTEEVGERGKGRLSQSTGVQKKKAKAEKGKKS